MDHRDPGQGKNRVLFGLLLLVTSCVSYEPSPLESEARRAAWHERRLEDEAVSEFIQRLKSEDALPSSTRFDVSDGLTLAEARLFALIYQPDLRLARLRVERAGASAEAAGLWVDPQFSLGLLRITESVSDRMIVNPMLGFTLPISGRLRSERELASAKLEVAEFKALEAEREVWRDVRLEWLRWSAAERRVEVLETFLESAVELNRMTSELSEMGEIQSTEAALFELETIQRRTELYGERGKSAAAEQRLRTLLGLSPEAPARFVPSLDLDLSAVDELGDGHPTLARLRSAYRAAEAKLQREVRKQVPDLQLGPQYETEEGQSRIGIQGGLPIPIFNANRRAIAEATVDRELARAAYENGYQELLGQRAVALASAEALFQRREIVEQVLVPLVDRNLGRALQLLKLGEGSSLVALESQKRALDAQLDWIALLAQESAVHAQLEVLSGNPILPGMPGSNPTQSEESQ